MGSATKEAVQQQAFVSRREGKAAVVEQRPARQVDGQTVKAHTGEIVGLAGLAGHGQSQLLIQVLRQRITRGQGAALVAGDRQTDGVFPLWSIAENITISSLADLKRGALIDPQPNAPWPNNGRPAWAFVRRTWTTRFFHCPAETSKRPCSPALASRNDLILMDDPMRGVDVGTKREVYSIIAQEAAKGRTFIWYTTELEELDYCDHIYVFRDGQVVLDLPATN
jgi:ribose transport system ATP-binding protein